MRISHAVGRCAYSALSPFVADAVADVCCRSLPLADTEPEGETPQSRSKESIGSGRMDASCRDGTRGYVMLYKLLGIEERFEENSASASAPLALEGGFGVDEVVLLSKVCIEALDAEFFTGDPASDPLPVCISCKSMNSSCRRISAHVGRLTGSGRQQSWMRRAMSVGQPAGIIGRSLRIETATMT